MSGIVKKVVSAGGFAVSSLLIAFGLAWATLYQLEFSYGRWHDVGGIGAAIEKFGPQNYYRFGFAETTKEQREELFQQISYAVHHDGEGLADISYQVPGYPRQTLLTTDEVLHLGDVAVLVNKVKWLVVAGTVCWLLIIFYYYHNGIRPPSVLNQLLAILGLMVVFVLVLIAVGPTKAFSKMHEWVFPPGNPWFFYYQQSLMSTMMWAPRLFAWVAAEWAVFALIYFGITQFIASRLVRFAIAASKISAQSSGEPSSG